MNKKIFLFLALFTILSINFVSAWVPEAESLVINQTEIRELIIQNDIKAYENGLGEPHIDPEILLAFENQTWVKVMVNIWDTTGINIAGAYSRSNFGILNGLIIEFLENRTNAMLSELSESEFKLKGRYSGYAFYGNISKEGFEKLKENPYVARIHLSKIIPMIGEVSEISMEDNNLNNEESLIEEPILEEEIIEMGEENPIAEKSWFSKLIDFLKSLFQRG